MVEKSGLLVHEREQNGGPSNAETRPNVLQEKLETPTENMFHRNHADIVKVPRKNENVEEGWRVSFEVDADVSNRLESVCGVKGKLDHDINPIHMTYGDIKNCKGICHSVERMTFSAAMECAGNRREEFNEDQRTEGIPWGSGAISNASWSGASLRSLLLRLGMPDPYAHRSDDKRASLDLEDENMRNECAKWAQDLHLHLLSAQAITDTDSDDGVHFAASIPLYTAMHPRQDCLLATHQNGDILTQSHGFPLRAVIPGHIGARWVKWLRGLRVSSKPDDSPPMKQDYKMLVPPDNLTEEEKKEWIRSMTGNDMDTQKRQGTLLSEPPVQALGIGSAIQSPQNDELVEGAAITVEGYAVGESGEAISAVEVVVLRQESRDDSQSELRRAAANVPAEKWTQAGISHAGEKQSNATWSWSLWSAEVLLPHGDTGQLCAIVARASTFHLSYCGHRCRTDA